MTKKNIINIISDQKTVTLPIDIYERIEMDIKRFNTNKNFFINRIITNTIDNRNNYNVKLSRDSGKNRKLEFRLNKENYENYEEIFKNNNSIDKIKLHDSEVIRNSIAYYITLTDYRREQLIYKKEINSIEEAIVNENTISVKYKGSRRVIEPYFIAKSKEESYNYVYGYCKKNNDYRSYRLSNLSDIIVRMENQIMRKKLLDKYGDEYLKNLKTKYDPFLSYQKRVKAKLTVEGERLFEIIYYNRPEVIAFGSNGEILVECSERKAIAYFSQFIDEVEILEPVELRNEFKRRLLNAYSKYK